MKIALYSDDYRASQTIPLSVDGTPVHSVGLEGFIEYLRTALSILTDSEDDPDRKVNLEPAFPDYILNNDLTNFIPTITWSARFNPASLGGGKPHPNPNIGVREMAKRHRGETVINGVTYEVSGQTLDAWIRFDIWATKAADAESMAQWFRGYFMEQYAPRSGAETVWFWSRSPDEEVSKINNDLHVRSLTYYVKLEERTAVRLDLVQRITAQIEQAYLDSQLGV